MENKEYILCAAIHVSDGKCGHYFQPYNVARGYVVCGRRHYNVIATLQIHNIDWRESSNLFEGFITNTDRFVTRKEAWEIAKNANQIIERPNQIEGILFSEDLY